MAAAAQTYYGKSLDELTLGQMATIAGLPKAPSALNPISNPERSKERRHTVLDRMLSLGYITKELKRHVNLQLISLAMQPTPTVLKFTLP